MTQPQRLFIVDAMAMAFRSFYALGGGRPLSTSSGIPVTAVYGSAVFMHKLLTEQRPDYLVIATDTREPTFRHALYPEYKANRSEMPPDLAAQLPHFFELMECYGPLLRTAGLEADDLIGTLARRFASPELHVYIVSGDKDFMQLVNDHIFIYTPKKGDEATIVRQAEVLAKFGCRPEQVIDCLAIIGDASDNVPGVHGIGEKGAAKLIEAYGSLAGIYDNLDAITNRKHREALIRDREKVHLSRQLVTIRTDVELPHTLVDLACDLAKAAANERLLRLCRDLEFNAMAARIERQLGLAPSEQQPVTMTMQIKLGDERDLLLKASLPALPAPAPERAPAQVPGYKLVQTRAQLAELIHELRGAKVISVDTETTGLNIVSDRPIGMSLSTKGGTAYYVPLVPQHLTPELAPADVVAQIGPFLEAPDRLKVGHNIKFDLQMLAHVGLHPAGPFVDTMICDWLLEAGSRQHGLDACCLRHLHYEKIPTHSLIGAQGELPMLAADLQDLTKYACEDADLTLRLYQQLMPQLKEQGLETVLTQIDMPLVPVLAAMESRGLFVDSSELAKLGEALAETCERLTTQIHELAGEAFNLNSPKQLNDILFAKLRVHEQLGVKSLKKTKHGYSTDESVLQRLTAHPLPTALLEYREVAKLQSTYVTALPTLIQPATGRLHSSLHQTGTATGRLSSSSPNLQNIPIRTELGRQIRKAFKPKDPAWVMISADYSQIELRLLAHLASEQALAAAFASGEDIHQATAATIFGVDKSAVTPLLRSRAKAINFGIIYGMGARRLALDTGVSLAEATAFIGRYFDSYPGINQFIEETVAEARKTGFTRTITGRRRAVVGLGDSNQRVVGTAENVAVNTRIQGSAADLIKLAMIAVERQLKKSGIATRMLLQVHDELVFEGPRCELAAVLPLIKTCMEQAMSLSVPLAVQIGTGANWLEAH